MTTPRLPMFHLRRSIRLQGQETRRAQRQVAATQAAAVQQFAKELAESHNAAVRDLIAHEQAMADSAGTPEELAELQKQLH